MSINRKQFIHRASAFALGFSGLHIFSSCSSRKEGSPGLITEPFGPLVPDPDSIFDLPEEFSYKIISRFHDKMDDGFYVPHRPDGMATFEGPDGTTILIRNHEVNAASGGAESAFGSDFELLDKLNEDDFYDYGVNRNPGQGGTTTVIYDTENQQVVRQYLSLAGTIRNCAGGPTPWNSWLTCEEFVSEPNDTFAKYHGYVFEVPARTEPGLARPVPIREMGRFNHEAVAVDPETGIVYLTEDDSEGLLYRFIPNTPGKLLEGGRLQALMVTNEPQKDTRNWDEQTVAVSQSMNAEWIDLENVDSPEADLRYRGFEKGAARFARGEGMWYGNGAVYFACTNGGRKELGQIWKLTPGSGQNQADKLELFVEPNNGSMIENADNLTVAPWGDLFVCEDGDNAQYLLGITPDGEIYKFGKNAISTSELAGATFSPDGSTLFMNIQHEGLTLAITGPWQDAREQA
ncbi:PhoX family protein [Aliifodinibius sp. S!AR15-10]|uniref:alkaline phosphatase PhoX n=1 Tax=Aliifodinibius sp. S!AR15-10 TaxID=2950437 RepID=UPI00286595FB|nr:alkaline phosphatase PhoX [Aliifodinibius sp. S!AR15-10]MDR8393709.1 PhoX family protein [Aliifodinibius sp. S!AR15-10]